MSKATHVAEGVAILAALDPKAECDAQHDELHCGGPPPSEIADELREQLANRGWRWNEQFDCWSHFT